MEGGCSQNVLAGFLALARWISRSPERVCPESRRGNPAKPGSVLSEGNCGQICAFLLEVEKVLVSVLLAFLPLGRCTGGNSRAPLSVGRYQRYQSPKTSVLTAKDSPEPHPARVAQDHSLPMTSFPVGRNQNNPWHFVHI